MAPVYEDVAVAGAASMSACVSLLDVDDDPFNLRGKSSALGYRDDVPIPRTRAALQLANAEEQGAEDEQKVQSAAPLSPRSESTVSSASSSRRQRLDKDKENVVPSASLRAAQQKAAKRSKPSDIKSALQHEKRVQSTDTEGGLTSLSAADAAAAASSGLATAALHQLRHIGPLMSSGTSLGGLRSRLWTECVSSVADLRAAAEAYRGDDRADTLRAAVIVLCDAPGLACSNHAVWKCVSEACQALLQAAPLTMPSALTRPVVPLLLSRLADKRTASLSSSLLLLFAESSSARLVQRCVASCMDEQCRNARLVEHSILFLASLAAAFSPSALAMPALLALCRSHSDHSQQSVRSAVCTLLCGLYEQLGASFRPALLSSVASPLQQTLAAALDAVDADGASRPDKEPPMRGRGEDSGLLAVSLDALFPRVDLCSKLGGDVLSGLRDKQWKARQLALQQLTGTLEQCQHRVTLKDGGAALMAALAPLLTDPNAMLAVQALGALRQLIAGVGEGMARWRDKLVPGVLAGVLDAKKAVREQAVAAMREWLGRLGVAAVLRLMGRAVEGANSGGRLELIELLLAHRAEEAEWAELVPCTLDCLCDKSGEVRAAADRLTESLIAHCGYQPVNAALHRMKAAYVLQLQPTVDKHRLAKREHAVEAQQLQQRQQGGQQAQDSRAALDQPPQPSQAPPKSGMLEAASGSEKGRKPHSAGSKQTHKAGAATGSAQKREQHQQAPNQTDGEGAARLQCAGRGGASASEAAGDAEWHPFLGRVDWAARQKRLLRDGRRLQSGAFREWSADEREETSATLATLVSPALHAAMTSADFARLLDAARFFTGQLSLQPLAVHAIADVLLRWVSALMGEASPKLLMAALSLLAALCSSYHAHGLHFADAEMLNCLPSLVERLLGHNVQRVRRDAGQLLVSLAARGLFSRAKLIAALLQGVDSSKNKRVVAESCECLGQLWGAHGSELGGDVQLSVWNEMKRGLPQVALLLCSQQDPTVRMAALSAVVSAHSAVGEQLWVVLSGASGRPPLPDKALSMIEERVKRTRMDASAQQRPASDAADDSAALPPSSCHALALTPLRGPAASQRTPVSGSGAACRHPPPSGSPASAQSNAALVAVGRSRGRKQSVAPTLSSLNSSLASLEAMHTTLAPPQQTASVQPAGPAAALSLPVVAAALSSGSKPEQLAALLSLSAALDQPAVSDAVVGQYAACAMAAAARTLRCRTLTTADRRAVLRIARLLCCDRHCLSGVRAELSSELCHALLASTAAELQSGASADATRELANLCVQAVLDCRSAMEQLSVLASALLSALVSASPYLSSLVAPFLLRWGGVQRLHCEAAAVDASSLLSWLHRLLVAARSSEPCDRCVVECLDQLSSAAYECAGSEQRLTALLSGYPIDSPLLQRMTALCQQSTERREREPHTAMHSHSPLQPAVHDEEEEEEEEEQVGAAVALAAPASPPASVRLDQLLSAPSSCSSPAPVSHSYVARFQALQQRLRQQAPFSSAIHRTAEPLSEHSAQSAPAQPASPPRRNTTGAHSSSATSSVSAILRDLAPPPSAALSRSAAFEAMRVRMRAQADDSAALPSSQQGSALSREAADSGSGSSGSSGATSLSALLASPAAYQPSQAAASSQSVLPAASLPVTSSASCAAPSASLSSSSGSAVSALRARLAAIHAAQRA